MKAFVAMSIAAVGYMLQHSLVLWPADVQPRDLAWQFPSHQYNRSLSEKIRTAEQKENWRASTHLGVSLEWDRMGARSLTGSRTLKYSLPLLMLLRELH